LSVARSNVSTSLRELQSWGVVKVVHVLGDRRDYFESMKDVWEMARIVLDGRKQREIDPTLAALRECVVEAQKGDSADPYSKKRLQEMLEFLETMTSLYDELRRIPTSVLRRIAGLRGKLSRLLAGGPRRRKSNE
jgi:DNA-binding transcriptional regulator GbsR (MarR family)